MEALIVLAFFLALGPLAVKWGRDTRDSLGSQESEFARLGFNW